MRIACFAHSLTTTSSTDLGDAHLAPVEHARSPSAPWSWACETGITSRQSSPASHSWVICFARSSTVLLVGCQCGARARGGRARARSGRSAARARAARGRRRRRRRDRRATTSSPADVREPGRDLPAVVGAVVLAQPEIEEARRRRRARGRARASAVDRRARGVRRSARAATSTCSSSPSAAAAAACIGDRRHQPGVLARLDEVRDEVGIAGVEADAHARQVRPLRQAVHREHAVEPAAEDRRGLGRELRVALVARDDDAARRAPTPRPSRSASAPAADDVGLPGSFTQSTSARSASASAIASRSRCQSASSGTGTARQPASVAPIS